MNEMENPKIFEPLPLKEVVSRTMLLLNQRRIYESQMTRNFSSDLSLKIDAINLLIGATT